jgi:hypothetical protein
VSAAERISPLSRKRCRELFEPRVAASRIAKDYGAICQRLIDAKPKLIHAA